MQLFCNHKNTYERWVVRPFCKSETPVLRKTTLQTLRFMNTQNVPAAETQYQICESWVTQWYEDGCDSLPKGRTVCFIVNFEGDNFSISVDNPFVLWKRKPFLHLIVYIYGQRFQVGDTSRQSITTLGYY